MCCYNPARVYGYLPQKGLIEIGFDADLVIVDMDKELTVGDKPVYSEGDYTCWAGWTFKGWPVLTMLRGNIIMEDGKVTGEPGSGQFIPSKTK